MIHIIRFYFRLLSALSSRMAGHQAFQLFQRPINKKIKDHELEFYKKVKTFSVPYEAEPIACFEMGHQDGKLIFMVHGWESNAASFHGIAKELANKGYRIILFNLPAHGYSKLTKTNIKMSKEVFLEVIKFINPEESFSVIAHSFGSAVTSYSLSDSRYNIDKLIFLTTPNSIKQVFQDFAHYINLSLKGFQKLCNLAEEILAAPLESIEVEKLYSNIKYNRLLIIHDKMDKIISLSNSVRINEVWPNSQLIEIEKTGHYRMLWSPLVIHNISNELDFKTLEYDNKTNRLINYSIA